MVNKKQYKILIVEDEASLQKALGDKLQREGWEIGTATNGEEGLMRIKSVKPDLVILDLRMPKMDGFEMLDRLRKEHSQEEMPVMILTNYSDKNNISKALKFGAEAFLVKANYSLDEIVKKIKEKLI